MRYVEHNYCRYLLRSQREWVNRGGFIRIYPRPMQRVSAGGDQLERLLGYLGQLYPEYASPRDTAAANLEAGTASAKVGAALEETSWMVCGPTSGRFPFTTNCQCCCFLMSNFRFWSARGQLVHNVRCRASQIILEGGPACFLLSMQQVHELLAKIESDREDAQQSG